MKQTSETIVFFGNERLATAVSTDAPVLRGLIQAGYKIAAVVSNHTTAPSRHSRELEIADVAREYNIPLLLPARVTDIQEQLESYGAAAGVLVAYGKIVPSAIIDIFPKGIINIHPSLLPKHRGPTPLESVILDGSTKTGVSLMALAKEMDAGPIYAQSELDLVGDETKQELADKLLNIGASMLLDLLPEVLDGSVVAIPQDDNAATFDKRITKDDGRLDLHKTAVQLAREIRAYQDWPKSRLILNDVEVVVTDATATRNDTHPNSGNPTFVTPDSKLGLVTAEGVLVVNRLKPAGKAVMTAEAFLLGYGPRILSD